MSKNEGELERARRGEGDPESWMREKEYERSEKKKFLFFILQDRYDVLKILTCYIFLSFSRLFFFSLLYYLDLRSLRMRENIEERDK